MECWAGGGAHHSACRAAERAAGSRTAAVRI